ncbi:MAG: leucyl/phenylalanyl-tRNA--protein transferase [Cytophagales bacterium]|nr:leucyl/phenylalanyl-tRNA--protein transferase [Cytophagales bacterium]
MSHPPPTRRLPVLGLDSAFPPADQAWGDADPIPGLLCAGADLSVERLVWAYSQGIFPWFSEGEPILWWSPDPRMVLQVADFNVSRSFGKVLRQFQNNHASETLMDTAFPEVIARCAHTARAGQQGTWIVPAMQAAYVRLHEAGFAHSVETWVNGKLVGGLYFTQIGKAVFGESMFSLQTNASKMALAALVEWCKAQGIAWIDCQQQTTHLASLGAKPIARSRFMRQLAQALHA